MHLSILGGFQWKTNTIKQVQIVSERNQRIIILLLKTDKIRGKDPKSISSLAVTFWNWNKERARNVRIDIGNPEFKELSLKFVFVYIVQILNAEYIFGVKAMFSQKLKALASPALKASD